jgi:hypothetical protein
VNSSCYLLPMHNQSRAISFFTVIPNENNAPLLYLYVTACRRRRFGGRVTQRHRGSDVAARGFPLTSSSPMKSSARLRNCKEDKYRVRVMVPGLRARNTAQLTRCTKQSDGRKCVINTMASGVCAPRPWLAALLPLSNF